MRRSPSFRFVAAVLTTVASFALACSRDALLTAPKTAPLGGALEVGATPPTGPAVVISQVYGGGGNASSFYKNDFIEIHNRTAETVDLTGWSVQYASANGTTFLVTPLTGAVTSIAPGQYLLIQEAAGTTSGGGSTPLPNPSFFGTIAMSGTDAKVALVTKTSPVTCSGTPVVCSPASGSTLVDLVSYGSVNFSETAPAPKLSNTTSASRNANGCTDTDDNSADFTVGAVAPRGASAQPLVCDLDPAREVDHITVSPAAATITVGADQAFTAAAFDVNNQPVTATFQWAVDPGSSTVASIDKDSGVATGLTTGDVGIVATANGRSSSATLHVNPAPTLPATRFSELHYDNSGDDNDEMIEIEGPAGTDLTGWSVILYDAGTTTTPPHVYDSKVLSGTIPATCDARGVVVVRFDQIQNGPRDAFALVHGNEVVEFLSYEGTMVATDGPAMGLTSTDINAVEESNSPELASLQRNAAGAWSLQPRRSFGRCNADGPPPFDITFTGRERLADPPLPIGFEDQLFAAMTDKDGAAVSTTFAWTSDTPEIASIDARGVMHALATGTAVLRATAENGTSVTYRLLTTAPEFSTTAVYSGNTEFGIPHDADASDDRIVVHPEFTASYNRNRNTPNWVSWVVEPSHFGASSVDRCDCFSHDPSLPNDFTHISTADYTGAGASAGYGIDRGHLARSFDFTAAPGDNAMVYLFSNIIPQAADVNQGQWADEENYLGNLARTNGKDIYTIAGVAGSKGTLKNEGKIVMPASVWKVAVIVPHGTRLADIHNYEDLEVVAVIMPNDPRPTGTPKPDWHTFITTVDAVEALSGYDLLDALPDKIENAVESGTKPPFAVTDGPYVSNEGSPVSMSGAHSSDPNGTVVGYSWNFGDGSTGSGSSTSHTYSQDGDYTVVLTVTDNDGLEDAIETTAHVANVAPTIAPISTATLLPGETYTASGSFADPGADQWSATVSYGDGSATQSLVLDGKTFALSHVYLGAGTFTVRVQISDDDAATTRTQFVNVMAPSAALSQAGGLLAEFSGTANLNPGNTSSLRAKLNAAQTQLGAGNSTAAANQLQALLNEIDAMTRSGRGSVAAAGDLVTMINRIIRSISM